MQTTDKTLSIVTWNVNGIRSRIFNNKICSELPKLQFYYPEEESSMANLIKETNPDIICIQETRCDEQNGKFAIIEDYNSYFNSSKLEKARGPNRYSGTAIYSKIEPNKILYNVPGYDDQEGRIIIAYYTDFIVINVTYLFVVIGTDTTEIKGPKKDVSNDGTIANVPVFDILKKLRTTLQNFAITNLPYVRYGT